MVDCDSSNAPAPARQGALRYQSGFGNEHASEAIPGALPMGRNSPQRVAYGLYAEQINGTAFTVPRGDVRRSWMYRILPSAAAHGAWARLPHDHLDEDAERIPASPARYRWLPWQVLHDAADFLDGLTRLAQSGSAREMRGIALYAYAANRSMNGRVFSNVDAELLIIVQSGRLFVTTEMGRLEACPGEIVLLPRALRFKIDLIDARCIGFVCENFGAPFRLPELGPIGSNGLANARDFMAPVAWYEDEKAPLESICKYGGVTWSSTLKRSPFDVVAWHGTYAPYKYDLRRFNAVHSATFDHSDPSIYTALTSPTTAPGVANADFCVLPPRWIVAEGTFRPPYFHRNVMSEFVISIQGRPESRGEDYSAGSCHLHNRMVPHGPDPEVFRSASAAELMPSREDTLMVLFESELPFSVSPQALQSPNRVLNYEENWDLMPVLFAHPGAD